MDKYSIFLSHIHEERKLAETIKESIEEVFMEAVHVFVSSNEDDIRVGTEWFNEIEDQLSSAETIVLLLTPSSIKRPWINFEAGGAWALGKHVVPVAAKGLEIDDLPPRFNRKMAIQLSDSESHNQLVAGIAGRANLKEPRDFSFPLAQKQQSQLEGSSLEVDDSQEGDSRAEPSDEEFRPHLQSVGGLPYVSSDRIFFDRMCDAFPGHRNAEEIDDPDSAIDRLEVLLRDPLRADNPDKQTRYRHPFYWVRGSLDLPIKQFERLNERRCLIDHKDIEISRLVSVRCFDSGERDFVYIEVEADEPADCYKEEYTEIPIEDKLRQRDSHDGIRAYHIEEEYGLWNGHEITRGQYDDGAAIVNGELVSTIGEAELRSHYVTRTNFLITAQKNVVSHRNYQRKYTGIMNAILKGEASLEELIALVGDTPRPNWFDRRGT